MSVEKQSPSVIIRRNKSNIQKSKNAKINKNKFSVTQTNKLESPNQKPKAVQS